MIEKYIKEVEKMVPSAFQHKGDTLYLFAKVDEESRWMPSPETLLPLVEAIKAEELESVCFFGENNLFDTLVECCTPSMLGFDITTDSELEEEDFLRGKCGYAAVVSVNDARENDFVDRMFDAGVALTLLGHVTKGGLRIDDEPAGCIDEHIR